MSSNTVTHSSSLSKPQSKTMDITDKRVYTVTKDIKLTFKPFSEKKQTNMKQDGFYDAIKLNNLYIHNVYSLAIYNTVHTCSVHCVRVNEGPWAVLYLLICSIKYFRHKKSWQDFWLQLWMPGFILPSNLQYVYLVCLVLSSGNLHWTRNLAKHGLDSLLSSSCAYTAQQGVWEMCSSGKLQMSYSLSLGQWEWSWTYLWTLYNTLLHLQHTQYKLYYRSKSEVCVSENIRLTLSHYAGQSRLELVFGLFHLLLVLTLLGRQPADVAVGRLDHGVEVVGVPAVDLTSLQPGQEHAHRFGKLIVI